MLRVVVNTLTADGMSSLLNRDNFTQPIHMHFSEKEKAFPQLFCASLKSIFS